ncbi:MAG: hypothetical protein E7256_09500 [Lachnospiraceae bacterium]|nr:hypothetical protein [Lachnospiraceae bacterium]
MKKKTKTLIIIFFILVILIVSGILATGNYLYTFALSPTAERDIFSSESAIVSEVLNVCLMGNKRGLVL